MDRAHIHDETGMHIPMQLDQWSSTTPQCQLAEVRLNFWALIQLSDFRSSHTSMHISCWLDTHSSRPCNTMHRRYSHGRSTSAGPEAGSATHDNEAFIFENAQTVEYQVGSQRVASQIFNGPVHMNSSSVISSLTGLFSFLWFTGPTDLVEQTQPPTSPKTRSRTSDRDGCQTSTSRSTTVAAITSRHESRKPATGCFRYPSFRIGGRLAKRVSNTIFSGFEVSLGRANLL